MRVSLVLHREFGSRLEQLAESGAVWIVDAPRNRSAIREHWQKHPGQNHLDGVTSFRADESRSEEDLLADQMDMIDLHHGPLSSDQPYTELMEVGLQPNLRFREVLAEYGFVSFKSNDDGFLASGG